VLVRDGRAVVEVSDTGIGIPPLEQSRVFERFFRASNVGEQAPSGTGLGLSVAKAIADAHGGDLFLTSEGAGTTARIVLPLDEAPTRPAGDFVGLGV
jgi:signal transduction histidine kinase